MKHSFSKIYVGAIALLIGASSCSDQFLKDKKDYNNMTTVDVYSDPQQATAVFATIYKIFLYFNLLYFHIFSFSFQTKTLLVMVHCY